MPRSFADQFCCLEPLQAFLRSLRVSTEMNFRDVIRLHDARLKKSAQDEKVTVLYSDRKLFLWGWSHGVQCTRRRVRREDKPMRVGYTPGMAWLDWLLNESPRMLADTGVFALLLSAVEFLRRETASRAETTSKFTERHRQLWSHFDARPELAGLLDKARDLRAHPLADDEVHFVNFVLLHFRDTYFAEMAGTYIQPVFVNEDVQKFMSYPAISAAWLELKKLHDPKFVRYVERKLRPRRFFRRQ
jgi:hypothetical protein